jgi:hypothetical protein
MTDSERLARIEAKVDALGLRFDDFRVSVEQRVSRLEVKAAVAGTLGGGIGALLAQVILR